MTRGTLLISGKQFFVSGGVSLVSKSVCQGANLYARGVNLRARRAILCARRSLLSVNINAKPKQMELLEGVIGGAAYNASSVLAL